jgi:phosphoglucosamine mutase
MTRYPQVLVNVEVAEDGKARFASDAVVQEAVEKARKELGEDGRIVVRPSGTEPLLRVMVEGQDTQLIRKLANSVAGVLKERLA